MDEPATDTPLVRQDQIPEKDVEEVIPTQASLSQLETSPANQEPGEGEPSPHSKPCDLCQRSRNVLIRCQIDETRKWHFICTGKCWTQVSGGEVEGDGKHPFYKYGGMWKNKHEYVSAKIKGKAKAKNQGGVKGPHRRSGHWRPKAKKHSGEVEIGADDGESDIEVSDVSDVVEDTFRMNTEGSRIQTRKGD